MDISLPPEKYSELLILCAHDTHHDFFQPKETFEKMSAKVTPLQRMKSENGGTGVKFCTNDACMI